MPIHSGATMVTARGIFLHIHTYSRVAWNGVLVASMATANGQHKLQKCATVGVERCNYIHICMCDCAGGYAYIHIYQLHSSYRQYIAPSKHFVRMKNKSKLNNLFKPSSHFSCNICNGAPDGLTSSTKTYESMLMLLALENLCVCFFFVFGTYVQICTYKCMHVLEQKTEKYLLGLLLHAGEN